LRTLIIAQAKAVAAFHEKPPIPTLCTVQPRGTRFLIAMNKATFVLYELVPPARVLFRLTNLHIRLHKATIMNSARTFWLLGTELIIEATLVFG